MKACLWMLLAGTCLGLAQEPVAVDLQARRESVETLKQRIGMRQKRLDEMAAEIRDRSGKTDKKIEELVGMLAGLKDSQDSKRRISQVKAQAVGGLKRLIETYRSERGKTLASLASDPAARNEALSTDVAAVDKLIEKRVADIVELVKSMPGGEDVKKYETDSEASYNGIYYENSRISEEWRQNRRDKIETEKARRETQAALEKAIAEITRRADAIRNTALAAPGITAMEKQIQEQELGHLDSMLQMRKAQLVEVTAPSAAPEDSASKGEADDLKELFAEARRDIANEVSKTLSLYRDAVVEREKLRDLRSNLAAREDWLKKNDTGAKLDKP